MTNENLKKSQRHNSIISMQAIYRLLELELEPDIIEYSYQYAQGNITTAEIRAKIIASI